MKCKHCGAEISLEQKFCPYCGAPNDQAMQHASDMEHFRKDYTETKTDVYTKSKKFSGVAVRMVILAILILATVGMFFIGLNYNSFYRHRIRKESNEKYEEYSKLMDQYLEKGQYVEFTVFAENHAIQFYYDDPYEDYGLIERTCRYYANALEYVMEFHTETDPDTLQYYGKYMIDNILEYYSDLYNNTSLSEEDLKSDPYYEDICRVTDAMDEMLVAELNLSPDDAASMRNLSEGQRSVLLEDGFDKVMEEKTGVPAEDVADTQSESGM